MRLHLDIVNILSNSCVNGVGVGQVNSPHPDGSCALKHRGCLLQLHWLGLLSHIVRSLELSLFLVGQKVGTIEGISLSQGLLLGSQQQAVHATLGALARNVLVKV